MTSADTDTAKNRGWPKDVTFVRFTADSSLMHLGVTVVFFLQIRNILAADHIHFVSVRTG